MIDPSDGTGIRPEPQLARTARTQVPLSPTQTDMLVQHLLNPDDRSEHCMSGWKVDGPLSLDVLRQAVDHLHHRHESLRSSYRFDEDPVAEPCDVRSPGVTAVTARSLAEAQTLLRRMLVEPFHLEDGIVWRVVVVAVDGSSAHLVGIAAHHIAVDGWSEAILTEDLSQAYNALLAGTNPLQRPAPTLAEVAAGRHVQLEPSVLESQRRYWRTELTGAPQLQYPPTAGPRSPSDADLVEVPLPVGTFSRLAQHARIHRVTPFVVLLATYGRALAEVSGQDDFCVGTPVAIRGDDVLDRAVTCLIEVLCLRLRFADGQSGQEDLARVSACLRNAFAARDISFSEVVRLAAPARDNRSKLLQNIFALQNFASARLALSGTHGEPFRPLPVALPTELFVEVWQQHAAGPLLALHYQPAQVPDDFVRGLAERILIRLDELS